MPAIRHTVFGRYGKIQIGTVNGALNAEELIRQYFEAWLTQDESGLPCMFAADAVYSECYGPEYRGLDQILRWFRDWNARGKVTAWDIKGWIRQGNRIAVEWYFACVYDGAASAFDGVSIVECNAGGKICALREFQSKAEHVFPYGE
jgi:ketosteroid isomerase-like protein